MCIKEDVLSDKCDRLRAFVHATRQLVNANAENGDNQWSGVLLLLGEIDVDLQRLEDEVRGWGCPDKPQN